MLISEYESPTWCYGTNEFLQKGAYIKKNCCISSVDEIEIKSSLLSKSYDENLIVTGSSVVLNHVE